MKPRLALLLLACLLAVAAWAQTGPSGASQVDSREECAALGGTWQAVGGGWRAACEVPWGRDECLRLRGSWTQVAKAAAGGRCFAAVSEFATAQQCLDQGGSWGPAGSPSPLCTFEPAKARSVARAADAGKLCDSQKDCTYGCVYQGPAVAARTDVMGRCRPTNTEAGCFSMVESGRLAGSICVK